MSSDVGRFARMKQSGLWAWMIITSVSSPTQMTADVQPAVQNGAWEALDGDPWKPGYSYPAYVIVSNGGSYYQATQKGVSAGSGGPTGTSTTGINDGTVVWKYVVGTVTATAEWQLGKWSADAPSRCMFWQNRFCMAATSNQPNAFEASVTGDFTNFAPTQSDGTVDGVNALFWVIEDDQVNPILWLSPAGSAQAMQLGSAPRAASRSCRVRPPRPH